MPTITWKKIPAYSDAASELFEATAPADLLPGHASGNLYCRLYADGRNCVQFQGSGYAENWFNVPVAEGGRPPTAGELLAVVAKRRATGR